MKNIDQFRQSYNEVLQKNFNKSFKDASLDERYVALAQYIQSLLKEKHEQTKDSINKHQQKKTIYFSMEFLMGRMITNNLSNLGLFDVANQVFKESGLDLNDIEMHELDAGLGNGGLGRLAACFLDSAASLGLPLYGNSIRYQKGFFIQKFEDFKQKEYQEKWLEKTYAWEQKVAEDVIQIPYFGYTEHTKLVNPVWVKAVPYDMYIVGGDNGVVTRLRLWSTEASEKQTQQSETYHKMVEQISESLYPDDSKPEGKTLRLQQQYLFSAAGVQDAIREHKRAGRDVRTLSDFYTFQLNDTHPAVVIPELMRILMDEEMLGYDEAWSITTKTCAYTNHTILSEALEKWNKDIYRNLLPRIYEIVIEMNRRFKLLVEKDSRYHDNDRYILQLVGDQHLRMANIAIYGSFSVNGVAALHTDILKNIELKRFYQLFPHKFNNKTNGVTHRRWLLQINPQLTSFLDSKIGTEYHKDLEKLSLFESFKDDLEVLKTLHDIKLEKKKELIAYIYEKEGITLNPDAIFDIQIKRLHEYKRQLMNALHIIHIYLELKSNPTFKKNFTPQNFIFGAKAAPSYMMAKDIIELINRISDHVNKDPETNALLKVVFVENYNVTYAEKLIPAADISEQISTASKEASGTGNMKFMMNGAITIGTMDGANVEIVEKAGADNAFIFGLSSEEVNQLYKDGSYKPKEVYDNDERLHKIFDFIRHLHKNPQHFDFILSTLLNSDYFLVLKDFDAYVSAQTLANQAFKDPIHWQKMALINIANSGFFSSDRTISQYNNELWHLKPVIIKET